MPGPFVSSPTRLPSSPARHGTLPNLWSGRDFGNVVPPAPGLAGVKPQDSFFKQLSVPDIELSEASLGTGFSFEFKKPPRPGQFFGRPPFSAPDASKQVHAGSHVEVSQKHPQTPVVPAVRAAAVHRGGPLLLDELSLPASKAISTTPPQRDRPSKLMGTAFSGKSHVPLVDALSPRAPDESSTPSSESRRLPTTSVSTKKSQQETNDDILSNMLPKAVVAETSPGHHLAESSRGRVDKQEVNARQRIACPSSNDFATRERPVGVNTPELHDRRTDQLFRRSSPSSACGDLERPVHRSPRTQLLAAHGPALIRASPHFDATRRNRSHSRTSNISKKRSEDHKHRRRTEDERKRKAMQHVAQYWNECMQILEDEKNQVNQDMECLQHQLQRQGAKLSESRSMLTQKQHELECAHSHRRQLEEEGLQIKEENRRLSDEAQSLRGQLAESKAQATRLQERHRQIRHRLNEAIQEQQALFKRSKSFYEDSMAALRKDKEERDSYKGRMDAALETSHRKREEMKGCFDEFRDRMERESRLKEETISELRSRIEEQEESLRHERDLAESLRRQVDLQQSSQDMVGVIASNVESFLRNYAAEHGEQQGTALVIESISERLDALMQHMQNSDAGGHSQTTLTQAIQGVEELISRQVVTMVADLASNQGRMEETLLSLGRTCGIQVEKIRDYLTYQSDEVYNLDNAAKEARHEFRGSLQSLQSEVRTARETCQQIKEAFEDVTQTELVVRQEEMLKRQADLDVTLAGRDERVGELEQQLRSLSQAYAEEIASLATKSPTGDDRNLQSKVDGVVADFRSSLEEGFLQEKNRSEEHLRQTQTAMAALEGQLRAVVDKLEVVRSSTPQGQGMGNVEQGSASASQLQQQAQHLEKQTKAAEQLRDRWQRDINAVDILRVQLKELQRRVPQLERFDSTLGKMAHMNEILHSTAQYLTCERKWARQQIDETAGVESRPDGPEDGDGSQPQQAKPDTQFTFGLFTVDKEVATGSQHGEASSRRKVTVYSPAGTQLSPSPPPSIEQEQVRRRGATQPRSILKLAATSSLEPGRVEQHAMRAAVRPVMGKDGATAASAVVEQIRAELLPSEGSQLAWSLPSVADFERDGLYTLVGGDRNPVNKAKRRLEVGDDVANTTIKRPRPETTGSVAGRTAERESDTE